MRLVSVLLLTGGACDSVVASDPRGVFVLDTVLTDIGPIVEHAMAVGPSGAAHMVWEVDDGGGYMIRYAGQEESGAAWTEPITPDTGYTGAHTPAIVVDTAGSVGILYRTFRANYLRRAPGGEWDPPATLDPDALPDALSIAADSRGGIHVLVVPYADFEDLEIHYFYRPSGGDFSAPETLAITEMPIAPHLVAGPSGEMHVLFIDGRNGDVIHLERSQAGTWGDSEAIPALAGYGAIDFGFAVDVAGGLHLAYLDTDWSKAWYGHRPGGGDWAISELVEPSRADYSLGRELSIGVDPAGDVHVVYGEHYDAGEGDPRNRDWIRYTARIAGAPFSPAETVHETRDRASTQTDMVIDGEGCVHIGFRDYDSLEHGRRCP